jgi:hypothetical protein
VKLTCPACGAEMTLDVLVATQSARDAVVAALAVPAPLGRLLVRYLVLFRTSRRQLSWDRVAAILGELLPMIEAGQISRSGRVWPAPQEYWSQAISHMLQQAEAGKLTLPLKSHGYLLEVIAGMGNKAEGKQELADHHARRVGVKPLADVMEHGLVVGDLVQVVTGPEKDSQGFIETAQPRFARIERATYAGNVWMRLNDFINVPWTALKKVDA